MASPVPHGGTGRSDGIDKETESRLRSQQAVQDDITEELIELATRLKTSAQAVQGHLVVRGQHLDVAEEALELSASSLAQVNKKADRRRAAQRAGLCFQLMVIMWVLVTMGSVYGFIRVTTLAGYRQRSVVAVRERVTSPESDGVFTPHLEPNIVPAAEETQNSAGGRDAGGERQRVGPGQASGSGEGTMTKGEGSGSEVAKNDTRATLAGGTGGQSTEGKALPSSASAQMSADAHGDLGSEKGEL